MVMFGLVVDDTVDPSRPPSRNVIIDNSAEDDADDDFFVEDEELLFARIRRARETISPYSADVADDRDSGTRAQGQDDINDTRCLSHRISPHSTALCLSWRSGRASDYASLAGAYHTVRSLGGRQSQKSEQRRLLAIVGLPMYWTIGNMLACGSIIIATSNNNDNDNDNDNVNNNSKKSQIATSMS